MLATQSFSYKCARSSGNTEKVLELSIYIYIYIYIYYGIFELYGAFISMDIYHKPTDTHRYLTVILNLVIPHIYRHPILPSSSIKVDL